jgi:hypothetical protein
MHNFTSNELLTYLTNTTDSVQDDAIIKWLASDETLKNEVELMQQTLDDLSNFSVIPNDRIMDTIMAALRYEKNAHAV